MGLAEGPEKVGRVSEWAADLFVALTRTDLL